MLKTIEILNSDKDTHFTGALAQNAIENESINFPAEWRTARIHKCKIHSISIQSDQALDWDVVFWSGSEYANTDLDVDTMILYGTSPMFATGDGIQIAGAGQYYYPPYQPTNPILYSDEDNNGKLHCGLINRNAVAKNAGATGEVKVTFTISPIN